MDGALRSAPGTSEAFLTFVEASVVAGFSLTADGAANDVLLDALLRGRLVLTFSWREVAPFSSEVGTRLDRLGLADASCASSFLAGSLSGVMVELFPAVGLPLATARAVVVSTS